MPQVHRNGDAGRVVALHIDEHVNGMMIGGFVVLALLPWVPPAAKTPAARVDLDNCNGCSRCFDDCPFSAITMVPRSDGGAYELEPAVDPDFCTSCGICAGSAPVMSRMISAVTSDGCGLRASS